MTKNKYNSIITLIKKSNNRLNLGDSKINLYVNNYSYTILRKSKFPCNTNVMVDGSFLVILLNFLLNKKIKRNSFDFTSNADTVFNFVKIKNKKLIIIGSTEENVDVFHKFLESKYKLKNIKSISGYTQDIKNFILGEKFNESLVLVGAGSPLQEEIALTIYNNFKNVEVYTCGGFITQTAESLKSNSNFNYYPNFYNKYNLRWLYRILKTDYVLKRMIFKYPLSVINLTNDILSEKIR